MDIGVKYMFNEKHKRPEDLAAPTLRAALELAKANFIAFYWNSAIPDEIGINKYRDDAGNVTWSVVFAFGNHIIDQATCYFDEYSGDDVVKEIFKNNFSDQDIESIEDSWDESWTEKK